MCVYEYVHPSSCATESDGVSILLTRLQKKIAPISDQGNKEVASPFVRLFGPLAACLDTQGAGISRPASHATSGLAFLWALGARGGLAAGSSLPVRLAGAGSLKRTRLSASHCSCGNLRRVSAQLGIVWSMAGKDGATLKWRHCPFECELFTLHAVEKYELELWLPLKSFGCLDATANCEVRGIMSACLVGGKTAIRACLFSVLRCMDPPLPDGTIQGLGPKV